MHDGSMKQIVSLVQAAGAPNGAAWMVQGLCGYCRVVQAEVERACEAQGVIWVSQ